MKTITHLLIASRRLARARLALVSFRPIQHSVLVCAILLALPCAHAADLVWIGGTGNWNVAGNWSPAQVPTAADNAFVTNAGTYTLTLPAGRVRV